MSDRIAVMSEGNVEQIGTPEEIYDHPALGVRRRLHRLGQPAGRAPSTRRDAASAVDVAVAGTRLAARCEHDGLAARVDHGTLMVRPERISLRATDLGDGRPLDVPGTVTDLVFQGPVVRFDAGASPTAPSSSPTCRSGATERCRIPGDAVWATWAPRRRRPAPADAARPRRGVAARPPTEHRRAAQPHRRPSRSPEPPLGVRHDDRPHDPELKPPSRWPQHVPAALPRRRGLGLGGLAGAALGGPLPRAGGTSASSRDVGGSGGDKAVHDQQLGRLHRRGRRQRHGQGHHDLRLPEGHRHQGRLPRRTINDNNEYFNKIFEPQPRRAASASTPTSSCPTYWMAARLIEPGWVEPLPLDQHPEPREPRSPRYTEPRLGPGRASTQLPWQAGITGIAYNPKRHRARRSSAQRPLRPRSSRARSACSPRCATRSA